VCGVGHQSNGQQGSQWADGRFPWVRVACFCLPHGPEGVHDLKTQAYRTGSRVAVCLSSMAGQRAIILDQRLIAAHGLLAVLF
jgi:hypothetical protein